MNGKVRASVIMATRGSLSTLTPSLQLVRDTITEHDEIIVVINGTTEENVIVKNLVDAFAKDEQPGKPKVRWLDICPEAGFCPAANAGMRTSKGQYICLLHDDVIVSENWLDHMIHAREQAKKTTGELKWGFVGPRTNSAADLQCLSDEIKESTNPAACPRINHLLQAAEDLPDFLPVGTLQSFCLLFTRDVYESLGDLDEKSFNLGGFEDLDYILRGREKGYSAMLCPKVFVFHDGGFTFRRVAPQAQCGVANRQVFMEKWYKPEHKKLCAAYVVKIDTDDEMRTLLANLRRMKSLVSWTVLLDDRSEQDVQAVLNAEENADLKGFVRRYIKHVKGVGENLLRDRNVVLKMARLTEPDWIWMLSLYEFPDEDLTEPKLQQLMNPVNPNVQAYKFGVYTFWRGYTHIRLDDVWGARNVETLFRNLPKQSGIYDIPGQAPRRIPTMIPGDTIFHTGMIRMKDLEFADYDRAAAKNLYYETQAQDERAKEANYLEKKALEDEYPLVMSPYSSPTVTYLMMARNEATDVLRHIYDHKSWLNDLVIVDTGSHDDLVEICNTLGVPCHRFRCCEEADDPEHMLCDFGAARNFALDKCSTDFVLFMDPDEKLNNEAIVYVPRVVTEQRDVYACLILNHKIDKQGQQYPQQTRQPRLFRRDPRLRYSPEIHETLEDAIRDHPELEMEVAQAVVVNHYGFLKFRTGSSQRNWRHGVYAQRLMDLLAKKPDDPRTMFALAGHLIAEGNVDDGDAMLGRTLNVAPEFFQARFELATRCLIRAQQLLKATPKGSIPYPDKREMTAKLLKELARWVGDNE